MKDCVLEEADTAAISPFQYSGHIEIKWLNEGALFHTVPLFVLAQSKVSTELFIFTYIFRRQPLQPLLNWWFSPTEVFWHTIALRLNF